MESDYPAGAEVPQDPEASQQGDRASLAGSVASVGSTGSDGAMAPEGTTAEPQMVNSSAAGGDQPAELSAVPSSGNVSYHTGERRDM